MASALVEMYQAEGSILVLVEKKSMLRANDASFGMHGGESSSRSLHRKVWCRDTSAACKGGPHGSGLM